MQAFASIVPDTRAPVLTGRDGELGTALATLRAGSTRLLTITGPAGVGKTRFAIELGCTLQGDYTDGVIWIDLAALTHADDIDTELARAVGIRAVAGTSLGEQVDAWLSEHAALLILDNAEHLLGIGPRVVAWLARSHGSRVIVTSRHKLNLSLETELYLDPLAVADTAPSRNSHHAGPSPAAQLFLQMAGHGDGAGIDAPTLRQVERLCAWLDGLPLAMEIVAARLPELTAQSVGAMLDGPDGTTGIAGEIGSALESTVEWSYRLLSPPARQLVRYLTVFVGGFSLELVEGLVRESRQLDLGDTPVFDCLLELSDHHLILPVENARIDIPRFRMLTIVAETARSRLIDNDEETDARQALASAITRYAEEREYSGLRPRLEHQIGELNENFHNITTTLGWLHRRGDGPAALRLVGALSWFWYAHGYYRHGQQWFERALELDVPRGGPHWARFLTGYGVLLDVQGQFGKAHATLREAYARHEANGDGTGMTASCIALGYCSFHLQRFDEADLHLHRAIELSRGITPPDLAQSAEGLAWENLGANAHERDVLADAEDALRRAIAIHHRAGYRWGEARAMVDLGGVLRDRLRPQEALAAYRFVLDPALQIGDLRLIAASLAGVATLLASDDQGISSAWFWGAVDALRPITGYPSFLRVNLRAYDRARNMARESVRPTAYETAYHAGTDAPVAEALALAQEVALRGSSIHTVPSGVNDELTSRERDVLELLVRGASTRAIAATLGITERTVSSHLGSLFRKFGINSRLELIALTAQAQ